MDGDIVKQEFIYNGIIGTFNGTKIYFPTVEKLQTFFGFWADEAIRLGATIDEILKMAGNDLLDERENILKHLRAISKVQGGENVRASLAKFIDELEAETDKNKGERK